MKICKIYIKGFQQFQDVELDFTDPETGEPVEKVCFIGSNGTGKSTILKIVSEILSSFTQEGEKSINYNGVMPLIVFEFIYNNQRWYYISSDYQVGDYVFFLPLDNKEDIITNLQLAEIKTANGIRDFLAVLKAKNSNKIHHVRPLFDTYKSEKSLFIYAPDESDINKYVSINDVPITDVNNALKLFSNFPVHNIISKETTDDFWTLLIYLIKKREDERNKFEEREENANRTKAELKFEFNENNPMILEKIAHLWNQILKQAGLEFDFESANNPIQLNDNLFAYIVSSKTKMEIPYYRLSTGIRNFIFRVGHIYSLFFNREIDNGILLVDEPENGLYPDFLFELIETYQRILVDKRGQKHSQMFFATHNPIIAAQFKPHERIILEWKEDGSVKANKGITPEGDDPNDILKKDFGLHQLMGPVGIQQWNKYLELKKKLKDAQTMDDKMHIASEVNEIGRLYNFPA